MRTSCRACGSAELFTGVDLGDQPLAGGLLFEASTANAYENKMLICKSCGLGQLSIDVDPEELYSNYNWRTSTSNSYVSYAREFADQHILNSLGPSDWVLEIASNDGYLLSYLKDKGVDVLGVDPAKNISMYAITDGVPVIVDFFSSDLAAEILKLKGHPKWIVANNVMAHTPDIKSFMDGISILCNSDTIVTVENPTIMNILNHDHFDVIFHEHYSYLSATSVHSLAKASGLNLYNIEHTPPQGGSNRYWISKTKEATDMVNFVLALESSQGLLDKDSWNRMSHNLQEKVSNFSLKVEQTINNGGVLCGLGASAKSTVLLNFAKVEQGSFSAIADDVLEKQGFYIPGPNIPVVSLQDMLNLNPTDIVIFAWNIREELEAKLRARGYVGNVWTWNSL